MTIRSSNLGFPRIGRRRELKKAVEAYWRGEISAEALNETGRELRRRHWALQAEAGIDNIPSNDFSFYDQMLDMSVALGAVPERFGWQPGTIGLDTYFDMARGHGDVPALEMTKWFDTNYHYLVPELREGQTFSLASTHIIDAYEEAIEAGYRTRPVIIGPVTWLMLGKCKTGEIDPLDLLGRVLPVYRDILGRLAKAGADWVQIDEPVLVTDLSDAQKAAVDEAYAGLTGAGPSLLLATYFGALGDNLDLVADLPVEGLHVDLVRAPDQLDAVLAAWPQDRTLSLGVVDGRNIWRTDLSAAFARIETAIAARSKGDIEIAPSCSLLHVPVDLEQEDRLDDALKAWLAFAKQKLEEVVTLAQAAQDGRASRLAAFDASDKAQASRRASPRIHNPAVADRLAASTGADARRASPYERRSLEQRARLNLPVYPTTTIGSFPQTQPVREARAANRKGDMKDADYDAFLKAATEDAIRRQEALGLDMLVHGEFERNDMVEYFGEQLDGFAFTRFGWVQSYGSRCVKPPVIFGDVSRPAPMTVDWTAYAQSLTDKPVKGMLTGPVTILQWSFVRDDQPRSQTCRQIAYAIRDEVVDLEKAGVGAIQIDEPALCEGLPLRRADWAGYLDWAGTCFRIAASGVSDATQIHTHMCYSEFNDIMPSIAGLDADVISIEASRSDMELLEAFAEFSYPNEIGPGIWDIHSPRVPGEAELERLLVKAAGVIPADRIWVNPDCGLKTRGWPEVEESLKGMVAVADRLRQAAE